MKSEIEDDKTITFAVNYKSMRVFTPKTDLCFRPLMNYLLTSFILNEKTRFHLATPVPFRADDACSNSIAEAPTE